jgi:hypothetical protein
VSKAEAENLIAFGRYWNANVWMRNDGEEARKQIINRLNGSHLGELGIRVGRGWRDYDPVVRKKNTLHTYAALVEWAVRQKDGGVIAANAFQEWYATDNTPLGTLPDHLQALAVITHFAEVGRGYIHAVEVDLYEWIATIAQAPDAATAQSRWRSYKDSFTPSLKYDENLRRDWNG